MAICNVLKELRESRNLSMASIAAELGIPKGTYASYEYGQREPNIEMITKFAKFYGVSADYLLSLDGSDDIDPVEQLPVSLQDKAIVQAYISLPEKERSQLVGILRKIAEGADLSISLDGVEAVLKPPEAEQNAQPLSEQPPEN